MCAPKYTRIGAAGGEQELSRHQAVPSQAPGVGLARGPRYPENLHLQFGGLKALNRVCFKAKDAELVAIVRPQQHRKTALLNCINSMYIPTTATYAQRPRPHHRAGRQDSMLAAPSSTPSFSAHDGNRKPPGRPPYVMKTGVSSGAFYSAAPAARKCRSARLSSASSISSSSTATATCRPAICARAKDGRRRARACARSQAAAAATSPQPP